MFDGFKFKKYSEQRSNDNNDNREKKEKKRVIIIISVFAAVVVIYTLYQVIFGTESEKTAIFDILKNDFHISKIDITIMVVLTVILLIRKIKKGNDF